MSFPLHEPGENALQQQCQVLLSDRLGVSFAITAQLGSISRSPQGDDFTPRERQPCAVRCIDRNGRTVPRSAINFDAYTAANFPYAMRQPPSDGNALGLVKFLFPNKYNIYLHDTPSKSLFAKEIRAFSHGCIRLADPFDFARALLARQSPDPEATFQNALTGGNETVISLVEQVPVHLVYFTAFSTAKGRMNYRRDIYGRDAAIFQALAKAGVELRAVQG